MIRLPFFPLLFVLLWPPAIIAADQESLVQLAEYVGADYVNAVRDGVVANDEEYAEMLEFAARLDSGVAALPDAPVRTSLMDRTQALVAAVGRMAEVATITSLTREIRDLLVDGYGIALLPRAAPDMVAARASYQTWCATCHGDEGRGDGPAAAGMEPPPIDFHDRERFEARSLLGLYSTITDGVDGTAMTGFEDVMDDTTRWALAFHVGAMAVGDEEDARGAAALQASESLRVALTLQRVIAGSPADAMAQYGVDGVVAVGHLRRHPGLLFNRNRFVELSRERLEQVGTAYAAGDTRLAREAALSAYLDGFEMIEQQLAAVDPEALRVAERRFMAVRNVVERGLPRDEVDRAITDAIEALDAAAGALDGEGLGRAGALSASFVILFREGLEALLIVAALLTFTRKAGAHRATRFIHAGWSAALVAGGLTWFAATALISISGASREVTEGIGGVLAAGILFYVGFWMHSNGSNRAWLGYLRGQVDRAVAGGTLWALAMIAFVSVYRELFETILFYQALWSQVLPTARAWIFHGIAGALVALAVLGALIFRVGMRLPLAQFFRATSVVLLVLAVILLGKGIAALQEAGWVGVAPLELPTLSWIGFYPTLQGLVAQLAAIACAAWLWWRTARRES